MRVTQYGKSSSDANVPVFDSEGELCVLHTYSPKLLVPRMQYSALQALTGTTVMFWQALPL